MKPKIGKLIPHRFFSCLIFLLLSFFAQGLFASVQVGAFTEPSQVAVGEHFLYIVQVKAPDGATIGEPRLPDLTGFELVNQNVQNTSAAILQMEGGRMKFTNTVTRSFQYELVAKREGAFQIAAAEVVVNSKAYTTKPLVLNVSRESSGGGGGGGSGLQPWGGAFGGGFDEEDPTDQLFRELLEERGGALPKRIPDFKGVPKNEREAFFVTLELDKLSVFEGEQVFANWYIYTRGNIFQLDRLKFPDLKGFWKEDVEAAPQIIFQNEIINGVNYKKALLASHAIFPLNSGTLVVDEFKIKAQVALPSFGGFGIGQPRSYTKSSERVKLEAKPLPLPKPLNFSGAVGTYQIVASLDDKKAIRVGEPFELKVRFEGEGNAKLIDTPNLNLPETIDLYEVKNESKYFKSGQSFKEFNFLLMPKTEGEITLNPFAFSYFDPVKAQYVQKEVGGFTLKVEPSLNPQGASGGLMNLGAGEGKGVEKSQLTKVLLPESQLQGGWWERLTASFRFGPLGVGLAILVFAISMLFWLVRFMLLFGFFRAKTSEREVLYRRLKEAEIKLKKKEVREFAVLMINALYFVFKIEDDLDGFAFKKESARPMEEALNKLSPSLRAKYEQELTSLYKLFESLAFAPNEIVEQESQKQDLPKQFKRLRNILLDVLSQHKAE